MSSSLLKRSVELANKFNTGLHIHTAEAMSDQEACIKDHGKRVVQRLSDAGAMDMVQTILIHCVHLDKIEAGIVRGSGRWIVENIESNLNNNVGQAKYNSITEKVMLGGTDGMHSDMLRSAKAAFLAEQAVEGLGMDTAYKRFRNIHRYIAESGFKGGDADNNLVVLDYNSPTEVTSDNFLGHFIYGLESSHVDTVISNGKIIVKDQTLVNTNEDDILSYAREMGNRLWAKMK